MPICEVLFEISDPVGARLVIIKALEGNKYKVKENTLRKIVAQHQLSLTKNPHKLEIEFDPPTKQCILTTVTLRIEHSDCKDYMKTVVRALVKDLPGMKITSVKPKMSFDFKETNSVAKPPQSVHCQEIEKKASSWSCQYCGFENALGLERCKHCGRLRRSVVEPEELEHEFATSEENTDNANSVDDQPVID